MTEPTEYLTTAQSAAYLGISERGVRDLCERGRIGRRIGRNWAIPIDEVRQYAITRLLAGRGNSNPTTPDSGNIDMTCRKCGKTCYANLY